MATTDVESSEQIALGAYEAGAVSILCGYLSDEDQKNKGKKDGPLIDIIAGTSIGAMNVAVLISNVVNRKKSWKDATEVLNAFGQMKQKKRRKMRKKRRFVLYWSF